MFIFTCPSFKASLLIIAEYSPVPPLNLQSAVYHCLVIFDVYFLSIYLLVLTVKCKFLKESNLAYFLFPHKSFGNVYNQQILLEWLERFLTIFLGIQLLLICYVLCLWTKPMFPCFYELRLFFLLFLLIHPSYRMDRSSLWWKFCPSFKTQFKYCLSHKVFPSPLLYPLPVLPVCYAVYYYIGLSRTILFGFSFFLLRDNKHLWTRLVSCSLYLVAGSVSCNQ